MKRIVSFVLAIVAVAALTATTTAWAPTPAAAPTEEDADATARVAASTAACRKTVSTRHPIVRLAGADRYQTATCTSQVGFPSGAGAVVLARGDDRGGYADALAGTVLADHVDGPVLLTEPSVLPPSTEAELRRLRPSTVLLLGGTAAISDAVKARVQQAVGVAPERIQGADRAATAAAIAARLGATQHAYVVDGFRPADALLAGTVAARDGAALLLSYPGQIPTATADALRGKPEATIVGGYGVVDAAVEAQIRALVPAVERLSGFTRSETAASVARAKGPAGGTLYLVAGANRSLVDAISAGWLAARAGGGPVLYSDASTPGAGTDRYLRLSGLVGRDAVALVGGEGVLTRALVTALEARMDEAKAGGPKPQLRGVWAHLFDDSLKSPQGIDAFLDRAAITNMNVVVVQVSRRQDAYYDSDVLPRTPDRGMPAGLDLLGRLIPAAKARGLEVHAWYPVAQAWNEVYRGLPEPPGWVWREHGPPTPGDPLSAERSWITVPHPDKRAAMGYTGGDAGYESNPYLDLGAPAVRDHIVAQLTEVVRRYDVDAVHLDYIRYPGREFGYNHLALREFQRFVGRPGFIPPFENPTGDVGIAAEIRQWDDWRRARVTELVNRVESEIAKIDPDVLLSAAVIAQGDGPATFGGDFRRTVAYDDLMQDWPAWARAGTIDMTFPMAYFREGEPRWATAYDHWVAFTKTLPGIRAMGQGSWFNTSAQSVSQVGEAVANTHGAVLFSYQQDSASEPPFTMWDRLRSGHWKDPAPVPHP